MFYTTFKLTQNVCWSKILWKTHILRFFAVVMHPKEAAGDRTCESADQLVVLMNRLLKRGGIFV